MSGQVALQVAYWVGHMAWAESHTAHLVLQLLGFPKARSGWDLSLVPPPYPLPPVSHAFPPPDTPGIVT